MISTSDCIGCQACFDMCPKNAISFTYDKWGEGKACVDDEKCVRCGLCSKICPAINQKCNPIMPQVLAVRSKNNSRTGSSGGVFYELAKDFIEQGGLVYGAAFNDRLKLIHGCAEKIEDLSRLCKSKYLHSDMSGIYREMKEHLNNGRRIMFVGTPCQTSAVKNLFSDKYGDRIVLVDFLCHGTGTQKIFDACIRNVEAREQGKITEFSFRSKSRRAEHSYSYMLLKNGKAVKRSGYSFEFPYYNAYLKYNIFNNVCYQCPYAKRERVGDITLGDFWGIQKYNKRLNDQKGVSMISLNTQIGQALFKKIENKCTVCRYPIECAADRNVSFNGPKKYPDQRTWYLEILETEGEDRLVEQLSCKNIKKEIIYAKTPEFVKRVYNVIRGR